MRKIKKSVLQQEHGVKIFRKYITKNGKRIYPRFAKAFCFTV